MVREQLDVYVNDVLVPVEEAYESVGGAGAIEQAFASMYDSIERRYSVDLARAYGKRESPHAVHASGRLNVPSGLIRSIEPVTVRVVLRDSDNAQAQHSVTFHAVSDIINPEIGVTAPDLGFAAHEASDFTTTFRAFDNVKVDSIELYQAYGARDASGVYVQSDFGLPVRTITGIEARDEIPITTQNIDTPEYRHTVSVEIEPPVLVQCDRGSEEHLAAERCPVAPRATARELPDPDMRVTVLDMIGRLTRDT